jgi:hypothetical protein
MNKYSKTLTKTALGYAYTFNGPGVDYFGGGNPDIHFIQTMNEWAQECCKENFRAEYEANQVIHLLNVAFKAGKEEMRKEFRDLLK